MNCIGRAIWDACHHFSVALCVVTVGSVEFSKCTVLLTALSMYTLGLSGTGFATSKTGDELCTRQGQTLSAVPSKQLARTHTGLWRCCQQPTCESQSERGVSHQRSVSRRVTLHWPAAKWCVEVRWRDSTMHVRCFTVQMMHSKAA